jgi:hypothetical protein
MKIKNDTVWIVKGHNNFAVFSSERYAEEYRLSLINSWLSSIIRDTIPTLLNGRDEVWNHAVEYDEVIEFGNNHYIRVSKTLNRKDEITEWMYYRIMSNKEWKQYYEKYIDEFIVKEWTIIK